MKLQLPGSIRFAPTKELVRWFVVLDLLMNSVLIGVIINNYLIFPKEERHVLGVSDSRNRHRLTPTPTFFQIPTFSLLPSITSYPTSTIPSTTISIPTLTKQPLTATPALPTTSSIVQSNNKTTLITFYGWTDNSPPGTDIAYQHKYFPTSIHDAAGGTGTYSDPISLATDPNEFSIGTRIYVPYLQKYFIMEDLCGGCRDNWQKNPPQYHIDLWMNSDGSHATQLLQCEGNLTRATATIEINPPSDRPVSSAPLFNPADGTCYSPS